MNAPPADWKEVRLSEVAVVDPENLSAATNPHYEFKYISLENVSKGRLVGFSEQLFHVAPSRARRILNDLDVLLATVRPNLLGHLLFRGDDNWIGSTGFAVVRCRSEFYSPTFMYQVVFSHVIQAQIELLITGSNYPAINKKDVTELRVPLPPLKEQEAIAEALSDADAAIESLDALIAKKRDVKQAAMQQLLTGRTRLPGFTADWKEVRLGDLLGYEQPTKYLVSSSDYVEGGQVPVLTAGKSFLLGYTDDTNGIYTNLPTIIFDDFTTATQWVDFEFKVKSSACKMLRPKSGACNPRYVFERLRALNYQTSDHKRHWISVFHSMEMLMPPLKEQEAIAEALTVMDDELEALTKQVLKLRMVKEGMMQDLLTGKVRLV